MSREVTIFYWRKELGQADLPDTLNMFVKPIENFLEAFEKSFSPKIGALSEYSNPILSFIFSKSQLFSLFLTYNPIDVSCGHDFLLTKISKLSGLFKYVAYVHQVHRKFSRGLWKKVSAQKRWKIEILKNSSKTFFFGLKLFFKGL